MPTKNDAIEELYRSKDYNDCIGKMEPAHLRDDLKQEVVLALLETPDETFSQIRNIRHFAVRIIINMVTNKYHPFYKKFRQINIPYEIDPDKESAVPIDVGDDREAKELVEDLTLQAVKEIEFNDCGLAWYDAEMVRAYLKHRSFREMERVTKIPSTSCYHTVMKALRKLKDKAVVDAKPLFSKSELSYIQNGKGNY